MGKMDDIRKQLNIDALDEKDKKELFKKFIEHGGKVIEIEEEPKKKIKTPPSKTGAIIRKKQTESTTPTITNKSTSTSAHTGKNTKSENQSLSREAIIKENKASFLNKITSNLFAYFNRVTNLSGTVFQADFITLTIQDTYEAVTDLQKIALVIMKSKTFEEEFEIRYYFFKKYPLFYEMLLRFTRWKIKEVIDSIREKERTSPSFRLAVADLEKEITFLFREFYLFLPYKKQIPDAFREGFRILEKKEKMNETIVDTYMGRIRRDVVFLFDKYMLKLFYAYLKITNLNLRIDSREIPILLNITDRDRLGGLIMELSKEFEEEEKRLKEEKQVKEEKTQEEKIKETEERLNLPEEIQKGLAIIESIDYNVLASSKDSVYALYDKKDKVYRVASILHYFEQEYSFIMIGNKIKYYMEQYEGKRFDPKKDFNEEAVEINSVFDNIREYSNQVKEIAETENNPNIPAMQKHNLVHKASIQKTKISMGLRAKLATTMAKIKDTTGKIRSNYNKFLADPHEVLKFNDDINKKNHLEGKTTSEAIEEMYCFVSALHYLLTKGNLGGAGNVIY